MAEELLVIKNDMGFLIKYALTEELTPLILIFSSYIFLLIVSFKIINKYYNPAENKQSVLKTISIILFIAAFTILAMRGRIYGKAIGIGDVYDHAASPEEASLILNGVFVAYHTVRKGRLEFNTDKDLNDSINIARKELFTKFEAQIDHNYPFMRILNNDEPEKNYNFFIVLLEGWNPDFIDSLSNGEKYGATPNFDEIVKNSVVFNNAYAVGMRSIFGFGAAFIGIPVLPNLPMLGYGLELNKLTSVGRDFAKRGYYTIFTQASNRDSYRMCALASGVIGAQDSFGKEDIPLLLKYKRKPIFGYDYEMLMFTADKVKDKRNFLAFAFTATTHGPYDFVYEPTEKYPRDTLENEYLNTLHYSDYAVGELIKKAKKDGWFDNTIFIFLSDHVNGDFRNLDIKSSHHIPFVIYAPKIFKPQKLQYTVSQLDLLPTIYYLANMKEPYSALGKSVFGADTENRFAFFSEGANIGLITDNGAIMHNGKNIIKTEGNEKFDASQAADTALSLQTSSSYLIKYNRWFK
jgi:phosphoglycerol transferase MdoB-like AlkP superfamily enzyme